MSVTGRPEMRYDTNDGGQRRVTKLGINLYVPEEINFMRSSLYSTSIDRVVRFGARSKKRKSFLKTRMVHLSSSIWGRVLFWLRRMKRRGSPCRLCATS